MDITTEKKFLKPKLNAEQVSSLIKQKINSNLYCAEDFKKSFNQNCNAQTLTLHYFPVVSIDAEIIDFNYDYRKDHSVVTGYHGTISSDGNVKLYEDEESWTTTEHAEEKGSALKNPIVTSFAEQNTILGEYDKIQKDSDDNLDFQKESELDKNVSIHNSDIEVLSDICCQKTKPAVESRIKDYLKAENIRLSYKSLKFNFKFKVKNIIFLPVYIYKQQRYTIKNFKNFWMHYIWIGYCWHKFCYC